MTMYWTKICLVLVFLFGLVNSVRDCYSCSRICASLCYTNYFHTCCALRLDAVKSHSSATTNRAGVLALRDYFHKRNDGFLEPTVSAGQSSDDDLDHETPSFDRSIKSQIFGSEDRFGKRSDEHVIEKRSTPFEDRFGKRGPFGDRFGKRSPFQDRFGKRISEFLDLKRGDMMRLGKRSSDLTDVLRLGKREMEDVLRLGKRSGDFTDVLRLGKRGFSATDALRLGKRTLGYSDVLRLGKRAQNRPDMLRLGRGDMLRLGKRGDTFEDVLRLGKRENVEEEF